MAVYIVYRSWYEGPCLKRVARFEVDSVLSWFQKYWEYLADENVVDDRLEGLLGFDIYGLRVIFVTAEANQLPPPATEAQLWQYLNDSIPPANLVLQPHAIQVLDDDDEVQLAYYIFDDHFVVEHPRRTTYLLYEEWELPGTAEGPKVDLESFESSEHFESVQPTGNEEGSTFAVFFVMYSSDEFCCVPFRISGVRLPNLCRFLARTTPNDDWPVELRLLRSQLFANVSRAGTPEEGFLADLRENPHDETPWLVYSDWLLEQGEQPAGQTLLEQALWSVSQLPVPQLVKSNCLSAETERIEDLRRKIAATLATLQPTNHDPAKVRVQVNDHVAQITLHLPGDDLWEMWHRWIFFDDLWASTHSELADALMVYALHWDILSQPGQREYDEELRSYEEDGDS